MAQRKRGMPRGAQSDVGGRPTDLDFEKALMFFHAYMYGPLQGKLSLYRARGVRSPVSVECTERIILLRADFEKVSATLTGLPRWQLRPLNQLHLLRLGCRNAHALYAAVG